SEIKSDSRVKAATFDLDWTLIRPIKGKFSKNDDDWTFLPNRISTLKSYQDAGYIIAIFTNQLSTGKKQILAISKINKIILSLQNNGIIPLVLVSTHDNIFRKPNIGMWKF